MTERRRPVHLVVIVGVSAGMYAGCLAGVTALQSRQESAASNALVPATNALEDLAAGHDHVADSVGAADRRFGATAAEYDDIATRLDGLEQKLGALAGTVNAVEGTSIAMPSSVRLPKIASATTVTRVTTAAPVTHATTGASGRP